MLQSLRYSGAALASMALEPSITRPSFAHPRPLSAGDSVLFFDDSRYWSIADRITRHFDPLWDPFAHVYRSAGSDIALTQTNSCLLVTHAIAALTGHQGACRNDGRAKLLTRRLCELPPWSERLRPAQADSQFHAPGWVQRMAAGAFLPRLLPGTIGAGPTVMDKSIDPKAAEALMYAWRARHALGLDPETVHLIEDHVERCAGGAFFRYPSVRLNQINWNAEIYAHAATVTGDAALLRSDYRHQVERFATAITQPLDAAGSANLGPGYSFHYLPDSPPDNPLNFDSAEYASITVHFLIWYEQALRAGMEPIEDEHIRLLRAWVERIICGYWTHAGYLNWDTGFLFKRWHVGRTYALARQGLLAIALSPRFQVHPDIGRWARYMFDAGFELYERFAREATDGAGVPPTRLFGVNGQGISSTARDVFAARVQADAARAVALGLAKTNSARPPALYSFDPDTGRLAITTPSYSTAVVPENRGAFAFGGIELARLFDGGQRVAANIGGQPWASFGVVVLNSWGNRILATQGGRPLQPGVTPPLDVTGPGGRRLGLRPYPSRPYAGPFKTLVARGYTGSSNVAVQTTHWFEPSSLETRWEITTAMSTRYWVQVLFPTWGRTAVAEAVLTTGATVFPAADPQLKLSMVAYFYLAGKDSGYVVVPVGGSGDEVVRIVAPRPQLAAPTPGPTLLIELSGGLRFKRLTFAVRIAPASSRPDAVGIARQLRTARPSLPHPD
jgi:hypothetical protein